MRPTILPSPLSSVPSNGQIPSSLSRCGYVHYTSPPMSHSLPLLRRTITLEEALDEDDDNLQELSYPDKRLEFYCYLFQHRKQIEDIVSFHLGVPNEVCKVAAELREWVHGSFNVCIPVYIDNSAEFSVKKVFIRFPLPYKVGESQYPGNAEEKLRCEVATYIWIQNHCPDIPIPCLRGFGFSSGWSVCDWIYSTLPCFSNGC
jgi:hypothetical protein